MPKPDALSALDFQPIDLTREVSSGAIDFYVDELSGIYLPDAFKAEHQGASDVDYWDPEHRLMGKFGRYALTGAKEDGSPVELDDILVMGSTIGVAGIDRGCMRTLRHKALREAARCALIDRDTEGLTVESKVADYGMTTILIDAKGAAEAIVVNATSYEFGRADTEGRERTCELFRQALGSSIEIINEEPDPTSRDRILSM